MNKPILQLLVILLIVAFSTLVLLRFAAPNYVANQTISKPADTLLSESFLPPTSLQEKQHDFLKENPKINLSSLLEMVKTDYAKYIH